MLEIYSTVHRHSTKRVNSQNFTILKQLLLITFAIHTNFNFSNKLKSLSIGSNKIAQHV